MKALGGLVGNGNPVLRQAHKVGGPVAVGSGSPTRKYEVMRLISTVFGMATVEI